MWPRIAEIVIAFWLAISPIILGHWPADTHLWINDLACAAAIAICASASFLQPLRRMYLAQIPIAMWLITFGFVASPEALPALQNNILVACVLLLFAVVPTEANLPPKSWRVT